MMTKQDDETNGRVIQVDAEIDGKPVNLLDELLYYGKHPEEIEKIDDNSRFNLRVRISIPVIIGALLLCGACFFLFVYPYLQGR